MKFHESPAPSIRNLDRESTMVVLPLAAVEQHGPHMPTGTDAIISGAVAEAVEENLAKEVLLLPTLWLGASQHHLPWEATLTAVLSRSVDLDQLAKKGRETIVDRYSLQSQQDRFFKSLNEASRERIGS